MIFYKGAVSYDRFENMPLPEFFRLQENALKIKEEIEREAERQISRQRNG